MKIYNTLRLISLIVAMLLVGGCNAAPTWPEDADKVDVTAAAQTPARLSPDQSTDITIYAMGLVGIPYRYGGNTPHGGFDCSGLIGHVYNTRGGVLPPRTVAQLQHWGAPVASDDIRTGDLVVFARRKQPTHAGIYVGEGRFVHAPSTGGKVRLDRLDSKYWAAHRVAFRRP